MKDWLRSKFGGFAAFVLITALVAGGLGWATRAALHLEGEQRAQRAEAEAAGRLRLALWRLDSLVAPLLARETSRPFNHYSAVYAPPVVFNNAGVAWPPGAVLEPSPLLSADLPEWMLLHFQTDQSSGWESPQVLSPTLQARLHRARADTPLPNVTPRRRQLLAELTRDLPPATLLASAREHTAPATLRDTTLRIEQQLEMQQAVELSNSVYNNSTYTPQQPNAMPVQSATAQGLSEYRTRSGRLPALQYKQNAQRVPKDYVTNFATLNGETWFASVPGRGRGTEVLVHLSPLVPLWQSAASDHEHLVLLRLVRIEKKEVCQGILLDAPRLQELLAAEVTDLFPGSRVLPVREAVPAHPELTMTALPFQLDPGSEQPVPEPGWTPLRAGLALAWLAATVALLAVGLGGWSLLDLSERRIRFVSAVTHELRTPLTTLRLYLDMLLGGLVKDPGQRAEYLHTLHAEAERLSRLVANVLAFSRLEKQRPRPARTNVAVADLLAQVRSDWQGRCQDADKVLLVENGLGPEATLWTDAELVQQVLGNLIDNACKYSRDAADRRLWLRARAEGRRAVFEVEDRGPGVPPRERRSVFRAFRRGRGADVTAGGVGLGLALARRWARLLRGRLTLHAPAEGGACFRLELPADPTAVGRPSLFSL